MIGSVGPFYKMIIKSAAIQSADHDYSTTTTTTTKGLAYFSHCWCWTVGVAGESILEFIFGRSVGRSPIRVRDGTLWMCHKSIDIISMFNLDVDLLWTIITQTRSDLLLLLLLLSFNKNEFESLIVRRLITVTWRSCQVLLRCGCCCCCWRTSSTFTQWRLRYSFLWTRRRRRRNKINKQTRKP